MANFPVCSGGGSFETEMNMAQTNLRMGSACVPHALTNVSFDSAVIVRRETRRTAPETGALPKHFASHET